MPETLRKYSLRKSRPARRLRRSRNPQKISKLSCPPSLRPLPKGSKPRLVRGRKKARYALSQRSAVRKAHWFIREFVERMELGLPIADVELKVIYARQLAAVTVAVKLMCRFPHKSLIEVVGFSMDYGMGNPVHKKVRISLSVAKLHHVREAWMDELIERFRRIYNKLLREYKILFSKKIPDELLERSFNDPEGFFLNQ